MAESNAVAELEECLDVLRRHLEHEVAVGGALEKAGTGRLPEEWPEDPTLSREIVLTALWQTIELTSALFASWYSSQRQVMDLTAKLAELEPPL